MFEDWSYQVDYPTSAEMDGVFRQNEGNGATAARRAAAVVEYVVEVEWRYLSDWTRLTSLHPQPIQVLSICCYLKCIIIVDSSSCPGIFWQLEEIDGMRVRVYAYAYMHDSREI